MLEIETEILIKNFHCSESLYLSVIQGDVATILVMHVIGNVKLNFGMMYFDFLFILFLCSMHIFSWYLPFVFSSPKQCRCAPKIFYGWGDAPEAM
jgi:hypothetical protein